MKRTLAAYEALRLEGRDKHRLVGSSKLTLQGVRSRREFSLTQIVLILNAELFVGVQDGLTEALEAVDHYIFKFEL
jgi:hypothetical protein